MSKQQEIEDLKKLYYDKVAEIKGLNDKIAAKDLEFESLELAADLMYDDFEALAILMQDKSKACLKDTQAAVWNILESRFGIDPTNKNKLNLKLNNMNKQEFIPHPNYTLKTPDGRTFVGNFKALTGFLINDNTYAAIELRKEKFDYDNEITK